MSESSNRHTCRDCDRKFLSHEALQRHYDHNPGHADLVVDAADIEPTPSVPVGDEWVALEESVETFRTLPDGVTHTDIAVAYDPDREVVTVTGAYEARIDTAEVADRLAGGLSWEVRGSFLLLSFPRWVSG